MTQSASITHSISSLIVFFSILLSVMVSSSRTESRVNRNDRVPLFSDCRFWVDPASHMRLLRQKMASDFTALKYFASSPKFKNHDLNIKFIYILQNSNNNGMNIRVFFWWNTKTGKCSRCRQCEGDKVTGVPCHFMSDTVCLDKDDLGRDINVAFGSERLTQNFKCQAYIMRVFWLKHFGFDFCIRICYFYAFFL